MKKVQVCVKNGSERTKYYDVMIDNKQTVADAIAIVKKDAVDKVIRNVSEKYRKVIGYDCDILVAETNDRTGRI